MIVVSNTSPLNYLVLIDAQNVLPALYGRVLIPTEVADELRAAGTPAKVRAWYVAGPPWLEVRAAPVHAVVANIHAGEAAAIALAKSASAALLLIDDDLAYEFAIKQGLRVTRTLGVLRDAALQGIIDLRMAFDKLRQTNFRVSRRLYDDILADVEHVRRSLPAS